MLVQEKQAQKIQYERETILQASKKEYLSDDEVRTERGVHPKLEQPICPAWPPK